MGTHPVRVSAAAAAATRNAEADGSSDNDNDSNNNEGPTATKRPKTIHGASSSSSATTATSTKPEEDPLLTLIPETVLTANIANANTNNIASTACAVASDDDDDDESLKILPLPSKLAYPFWYDPHPIAKWAADRLKDELPPYNTNGNNRNRNGDDNNNNDNDSDNIHATNPSGTPAITQGKMYGVLVVSLEDNKAGVTNAGTSVATQLPGKLGYLQAYSGTLPRAKYAEKSATMVSQPPINAASFAPLVYDRFAKDGSDHGRDNDNSDDKGDVFNFERDEELLNVMTREIERLESCPERRAKEAQWKQTEAALQTEIADAKKIQKRNKRDRKARRNALRARLLADDNDSQCKGFANNKEAHACFLECNAEYRSLEDNLVQESAYDQREFKALKAKTGKELEIVQKSLEEHRFQMENLRQERKDGSNMLQQNLFDRYKLLNVSGETQTPVEIFKDTALKVPPSGTGDCAAIKLFQHAFSRGYRPVALAEFWWGPSPHATNEGDVARTHGNYYPCCRGKCEPILTRHMLLGTDVESDPLTEGVAMANRASSSSSSGDQAPETQRKLSIVYEDEWLVVVNKPHNVLSVPGRTVQDSIKNDLQKLYPNATGPILVHRLDYSTSGLLLAAKDSNTHKHLQAQFIARTVTKRYTALLEGDLVGKNKNNAAANDQKAGTIDLPLAGDYLNRPMQKVERGPEGKPAVTFYEIVTEVGGTAQAIGGEPKLETKTKETRREPQPRTRVHFYPRTGRTHQLRVHASHPEGLGMAIVGDDIYGRRDKRLCLHAGLLEIDHPHTKQRMTFKAPVPF
jgi:tRNA pseudouridine32 synthase/23S rRNA pseudouridine746 synthase